MKVIYVYWYKVNLGHGNFGDELNRFIISKLSGCKVKRIIVPSRGINYIRKSIFGLKNKIIPFYEIPILIRQFFIKKIIVGIGSVIAIPNNLNAKIWGSGIIKKDDIINNADFLAVRGKYTQNRLKELGFLAPKCIGDPAILLPLVYKPNPKKLFKLGIIPHYIHYKEIVNVVKDENILIVDLSNDIEHVIDDINSCEYTISTSLHGIIVSHVYNVPSLWFEFGGISLCGDDIKFKDYFSSVNIQEYNPFFIKIEDFDKEKIETIIKINNNLSTINVDINLLQQDLLSVAPFKVNEEYIDMLNMK